MTPPTNAVLKELELFPAWRRRVAIPNEPECAPKEVPLGCAPKEVPLGCALKEVPLGHVAPPPVAQAASPADNHLVPDVHPYRQDGPLRHAINDDLPLGEHRATAISHMDWKALRESVSRCQSCALAEGRTRTVFGNGDEHADWLFVGEAPGAEEDQCGEPFVGEAGKLLDNMLTAIQIRRGENVYISNVMKCRPPENRKPQHDEIEQCDPFLKKQIELIAPKLIVALGHVAAQSLLNSTALISELRGRLHDYHGVPVIVTYHPAYLLRKPLDKNLVWTDLCLARATMKKLQSTAPVVT